MVMDFHTHVFPEEIADRTISLLSRRSNLKPYTDGTAGGLVRSMQRAGVDYSVVLPIATKPRQAHTINSYAAEITGKNGIISFGSIHPFSEGWRSELDYISSLGLKGIKLHPDYQGFFVNDKRAFPAIEYAAALGLIIVFHSGVDLGIPGDIHCRPKAAAELADELRGAKLVFAHTGGFECWDEVEEYLVGRNVYFDISFTAGMLENETLLRIIRAHGADKCLFGSDSPWGSQEDYLEAIRLIGLDEGELEAVMYKNAARLLGMRG